ncbi:MAG: LytTR family transcriptional regulator [Lachnospiraceae bacterium]
MTNRTLQSDILTFIATYGESALQEAMQQYIDNQQVYFFRTKSLTTRIKISDIYCLQCQQHNITIHTSLGIYRKYGTLSQELTTLFPYGFIKCSQSCIVSLSKVRSIQNNTVTLIDGTELHISRVYAPKLLTAFNGRNYSCSIVDSNISEKIRHTRYYVN